MLLFIPHQQGMGVGAVVVPPQIDGVSTINLTVQYENVMIGSDSQNATPKWDIL